MRPRRLRLSPRRHTGKLLPHHHTSYGALAALLTITGLTILLVSLSVAGTGSADSGDITVNGIVPGPPPSTAPVIDAPANGAEVSDQLISVSGTCSTGLTVVVNDNQIGSGSAICDQNGSFSLIISLTSGTNVLTAYHLDNLNQSGPLSNSVTVTYQPSASPAAQATASPTGPSSTTLSTQPGNSGSSAGNNQFLVTAPYRFDGVQFGQIFTLHGNLAGGAPPYAVQIDWGDKTQILLSRASVGPFAVQHTYVEAGRYIIKLSASDAAGLTTYYQTTVAVGGTVAPKPTTPASPAPVVPAYKLAIIWPVFLVACLTVFSFWLGEFYDKRRDQPADSHPPTTS